jgi:2-polyprenyl-6-hydroxyphenyl methylase / 3-demethylubiquinone-9 3-methyltransferase
MCELFPAAAADKPARSTGAETDTGSRAARRCVIAGVRDRVQVLAAALLLTRGVRGGPAGATSVLIVRRGAKPFSNAGVGGSVFITVVIDNEIYDRLGDTWWDDHNPLAALHGSMTTGRMRYFRQVLGRAGVTSGAALDVGSGGGFLAEEFARIGFGVTGVEPSAVSVRTARAHARAGGLAIAYRVGRAERLPVPDQSFDVVYCCDVLEHLDDVGRALDEITRALKPGGVFLFDTPNRTFASRLATDLVQRWRPTRLIDVPAHDWSMFLRPNELTDLARRRDLHVREIVGLGPRARTRTLLAAARNLRRGDANFRAASERVDMGQTRSTRLFYMGYAVRGDHPGAV